MKGIARSFAYWPGIDKDIENIAKQCELCAKYANVPAKFKDHHWEYPKSPWERIHIDYAGPFEDYMLLVISDAYSKWLEVKITKSATAEATIKLLDEVFATYGVPLMVVSDNGTNFSSAEFNNYLTRIGVKYHKYTAPYHPATNGQAERNVQTVKNALKTMGTTKFTLRQNLNEFLRQYRNAPHSSTGQSPAQLFLGRQLRTRLDLIRPEKSKHRASSRQLLRTKANYRQLRENQVVYFLSGNPRTSKWLKGKVVRRLGDIHYEIAFNGKCYKRHINQIRGTDHFVKNTSNDNTTAFRPENGVISDNYRSCHFNENSPLPERLNNSEQHRNERSVSTEASYSSTRQNEHLQNEQYSTPLTSMQSNDESLTLTPSSATPFEGYTESSPTVSTTEVDVQCQPLRRSLRVRKPRVLFSP